VYRASRSVGQHVPFLEHTSSLSVKREAFLPIPQEVAICLIKPRDALLKIAPLFSAAVARGILMTYCWRPPSSDIGVPNLSSWKAKKLSTFSQEKVLLDVAGGWPTVSHRFSRYLKRSSYKALLSDVQKFLDI